MHEDFDAAKHMICHRCYGTTFAHYDGKKIYPERPCKACKGKGFHDRNFPFAQWMSNTTTEFLFAPRRTRSLVDAACPVCHGERLGAYGRPCENCRGSGLVLADTSTHRKIDLYADDDGTSYHTNQQVKLPAQIEADSGADLPPFVANTGSSKHVSRSGSRLGGQSGVGGRLSISAVAIIFVVLLIFIGVRFVPNRGTTQASIVTTGIKPPDLPIIGGAETAFFAKYGSPLKRDVINNTTIESLSGNISIAVYSGNRSVTGIIVVAGATGWSDDAAFAQCATFFPQDTRLGQRHDVTEPHNILGAWFRLGQSTLLASTLPQDEFVDPHHSVDAGTFIAEVYTDGPAAHLDNECSVKLSDVVVQPVSQSDAPSPGPTGTQVAGVPTPKPGVPSPIIILAPTQVSVGAGPTPTQVTLDVPSPTPGPTQTPLPPPTNTPPAPTATPVPPTDVPTAPPVPPTDVPTATPVPPTDVPTDVPTPMM